jgi:hypothetical protein
MPVTIGIGMGENRFCEVSALFISQEVNGWHGMLVDMFLNHICLEMLRMAITRQLMSGAMR